MKSFTLISTGGLLLVFGCGSEVLDSDGSGGGLGADGATSSSQAATGAGETVGSGAATTVQAAASVAASTAQGGGDGGAGGAAGGPGGAGGLGEGAGPPQTVCDRTAAIEITDVSLDVEVWRAGEQRAVRVTLTSPGDHFDYPGVTVQSDNPYVTSDAPQNVLFGLAANEPSVLDVFFTAADFLDPGTPVRFDVAVFALNEDCEGTDTATFDVTLE